MTTLPIGTSVRIEGIRKMFPDIQYKAPVPPEETRECAAYDKNHKEIGRFLVRAIDCITCDTISWRGYYWSLQVMAECGQSIYPQAAMFGFTDNRPLSGLR